MSIDWAEEVKEYKKQYDDDEGIHEYIESLLPVYFGDIYQTYHDIIGTPLNIEILNSHVGMTIDKILLWDIYNEYSNEFWAEYKASMMVDNVEKALRSSYRTHIEKKEE